MSTYLYDVEPCPKCYDGNLAEDDCGNKYCDKCYRCY